MGYVKYVRVYTRNIHLMMRNMKAMQVSFREKADKELDAEALHVFCLMPKWIPAKEKEKIRNQNFTCLF